MKAVCEYYNPSNICAITLRHTNSRRMQLNIYIQYQLTYFNKSYNSGLRRRDPLEITETGQHYIIRHETATLEQDRTRRDPMVLYASAFFDNLYSPKINIRQQTNTKAKS